MSTFRGRLRPAFARAYNVEVQKHLGPPMFSSVGAGVLAPGSVTGGTVVNQSITYNQISGTPPPPTSVATLLNHPLTIERPLPTMFAPPGQAGAAGAPGSSGVVQIAQTILGSDTATIDWSSIPSTYRDLRILLLGRTDSGTFDVRIRFNNDSGANYDSDRTNRGGTQQVGSGTSAQIGELPGSGATANFSGAIAQDIPNYIGTTFHKCFTGHNYYSNGAYAENVGGIWKDTSAINRITLLFTDTTKFKTGTVATLYGMGS